jgi:uncharacterized damage-inducible protein DinB
VSTLDTVQARLATQLEALDLILAGATPALLDARPASGDWSARENLAHLARHATVFLERLERILTEESPRLGRYRAEDDPDWPRWSGLPLDEALHRLRSARSRLIACTKSLTSQQITRTGLHPSFGAMTIPQWLDFFLLHEAHHLYTAMLRVAEARRYEAEINASARPT